MARWIAKPCDAVTPELVSERDQDLGAIGHSTCHRRVNIGHVDEDNYW